jgi:hypothetical protein
MKYGQVGMSYDAILINNNTSDKEPYRKIELASVSDTSIDERNCNRKDVNPCSCLSKKEINNGYKFFNFKGYDVTDLNGDGINDMIFYIEEGDCKARKHVSIKETYYFLPVEPFVKKTVQKSYTKLPTFKN